MRLYLLHQTPQNNAPAQTDGGNGSRFSVVNNVTADLGNANLGSYIHASYQNGKEIINNQYVYLGMVDKDTIKAAPIPKQKDQAKK